MDDARLPQGATAETPPNEVRLFDDASRTAELSEESIAEEPKDDRLTGGDASRQETPELSPVQRLQAASADVKRTSKAWNAYISVAGKTTSREATKAAGSGGETTGGSANSSTHVPIASASEAQQARLPESLPVEPSPESQEAVSESGRQFAPPIDVLAEARAPGAWQRLGHVRLGRILALGAVQILGGRLNRAKSLSADEHATLAMAKEALEAEIIHPRVIASRPKGLTGLTTLPRSASGRSRLATAPPRTTQEKLKRIEWVKEGKGSTPAYVYEAKVAGFRPGMAPRLSATDGEVLVTAKFDGVEGLIMIDRKYSVSVNEETRWRMLRQSTVAAANGFKVRWEVPNLEEAAKVQGMILDLGVGNVVVEVRK